MSHSKERKEKICLNCGAGLYGRYCHQCGQENIEPKQSAWHLVTHFFYDITHFDGKFFTTLKDLVARPGFLSREYMMGRRSSYLNPIRMYVFTSAFFFIIFFSLINPKKMHFNNALGKVTDTAVNLKGGLQAALAKAEDKEDSDAVRNAFARLQKVPLQIRDSAARKNDQGLNSKFTVDPDYNYDTEEQYDSVQHSLTPEKRDGWFRTMVRHKVISLQAKYRADREGFFRDWSYAFVHSAPQLLFLSLPIFALFLRLLYIRHKQYYYVDHGIFAIHLYIYSFIAMLFYFGLNSLQNATGWGYIGIAKALLGIFTLYYFYKAMRNFYVQGRAKTVIKYLLLNTFSFVMILTLFVIFFLFSALEI